MNKKVRVTKYIVFLCAAFFLAVFTAQAHAALKMAPVNPGFAEYVKGIAAAEAKTDPQTAKTFSAASDTVKKPGVIPTVFDSSKIRVVNTDTGEKKILRGTDLPASFSLKTEGYLTPVKDQGIYGTCWSFATMAAIESGLISKGQGSNDLSERHMAWFGYTDESFSKPSFTKNPVDPGMHPVYDQGGHYLISTALLSRYTGPVNETECRYSDMPAPAGDNIVPAGQLKNVLFLSNKDSSGTITNDDIKEAIYYSGSAVYVSFAYFNSNYNSDTFAYYYPVMTEEHGHAVTVVGWDDGFAAENFSAGARPASDGAWLVKNSWSAGWGDEGYFWISYEDANIGTFTQFDFTLLKDEQYSKQYSYDPLGLVNSAGGPSTTCYAAAIYTAEDGAVQGIPEILKAVSIYATVPSLSYTMEIYKGVTAGNPKSGTAAAVVRGAFPKAGYHTVSLPSDVIIEKGERFSVVFELNSQTPNYLLPVEYAQKDYSEAATAGPGETFYSTDGLSWTDIYEDNNTASICIKAFVNEVKPTMPANLAPVNGATEVSLVPVLTTAPFEAPYNTDGYLIHEATQWQVGTNRDFTSGVVYDSGNDTEDLTETAVPSGILSNGTTYYWRARHQANNGEYSDWSSPTSFKTGPESEGSSGGGCNAGILPLFTIAVLGLAFTGAKKR